jgi:hypothetical protein
MVSFSSAPISYTAIYLDLLMMHPASGLLLVSGNAKIMSGEGGENRIRTAVRIRPFSKSEEENGHKLIASADFNTGLASLAAAVHLTDLCQERSFSSILSSLNQKIKVKS